MKRIWTLGMAVVAAAVASGQIALKPPSGDALSLSPKSLDVNAKVENGLATSSWTYVFGTSTSWSREADFLIKIPAGGVVTHFAYWYQGERVVARIAAKDRARTIYRAIVDRQRDPALIELVGKDTFRVKIFPIDQNADLKVELKMVQALPDGGKGSTLTLPLKKLGSLESTSVSVESSQELLDGFGKRGMTLLYRSSKQRNPDLKFTAIRAPKGLAASLTSVVSGGESGFFTLSLTPSVAISRPSWKVEGPVYDVRRFPAPGNTVVLVGRLKVGADGQRVRGWVLGSGYRAYADSTVQLRSDANGAPVKLWAWAKIQASRSRDEIINLSIRHTVPSRYTSWIAIPTEERKRMARVIAQAEFRVLVSRQASRLVKVGLTSAEGKAITAKLLARAKELGISPEETWSEGLSDAASEVSQRWSQAMDRYGEGDSRTRRLDRELDAFQALGVNPGHRQQFYYKKLRATGNQLVTLQLQQNLTPKQIRKLKAAYSQYAVRAGYRPDLPLRDFLPPKIRVLARGEAVRARAGQPVSMSTREILSRAEKATGLAPGTLLDEQKSGLVQRDMMRLQTRIAELASGLRVDETELKRVGEEHRKLLEEANQYRRVTGQPYLSNLPVANLAVPLAEGKMTKAEVAQLQARQKEYSRWTGMPMDKDTWKWQVQEAYSSRRSELFYEQLKARRDKARISQLTAELERLSPEVDAQYRALYNQDVFSSGYTKLRDDYVRARHRGESGSEQLAKLYQQDRAFRSDSSRYESNEVWKQEIGWADLRRDRLQTLTELDRLDDQVADPEVVARIRSLEQRVKVLAARMGDPIVSFVAPNAKQVWTILPDGARLPLQRVAGSDQWEARFDVPLSARDGEYRLPIYVDGVEAASMPLRVDNTAPKFDVTASDGVVSVRGDLYLSRVVGFTPSGERVDFRRDGSGRFVARVPVGTRIVGTDSAHNRSETVLGEPELAAEITPSAKADETSPWSPPEAVSCLGLVGGELWVGTVNQGGNFLGKPRTGPAWPKQILEWQSLPLVRYADGAVHHGAEVLELPRPATALGRGSKGSVWVGHFAGFSRVGDPGSFVAPAELAGEVVTAIWVDGAQAWIGTQRRGVYRYDLRRQAGEWLDERRGLADDWITVIGSNEQGELMVGTFVGGAYTLRGDVWVPVEGTAGTCVTGIAEGWIATRQGVWHRGRRVSDLEATSLSVSATEVWIGTRTGPVRVPAPERQ